MSALIQSLEAAEGEHEPMPFVCIHGDPRCKDDPCPWGIARTLCNAPADSVLRAREGADQ